MKPMNYLDPVVCPDGCVKPLSEFAGGGSGGGGGGSGAVDCTAELSTYSSTSTGEILSAVKIDLGGGLTEYRIFYDPHGKPASGTSKIIKGFEGIGCCDAIVFGGSYAYSSVHHINDSGILVADSTLSGGDASAGFYKWFLRVHTYKNT